MKSHSPQASPDEPLLDATLRLDQIPPEGRDLAVSATEAQRTAIAARLRISAVDHLDVRLHASHFRGGIRILGELRAAIVQPCVVTFAPVGQAIEEPIDRIFLPGSGGPHEAAPGAEIFVDLEDEELPDHFEGNEVDLAEPLLEILALAIDPYPRAPGASLEDVLPPAEAENDSPFARLKSLKLDGDKS